MASTELPSNENNTFETNDQSIVMSENQQQQQEEVGTSRKSIFKKIHENKYINILLTQSDRDIRILYLCVFIRQLQYGLLNQILIFYFKELKYNSEKIGVFLSLTLFGDVLLSWVLTWYADSWKRSNIIKLGIILMFINGLTFIIYDKNFTVLLIVSTLGIVGDGSDVGPFKSIEESCMAHLTRKKYRPIIYSWHYLFSSIGFSIGCWVAGTIVDVLIDNQIYTSYLSCYKFIFGVYCGLSLIKLFATQFFSPAVNMNFAYQEDEDYEEQEVPLLEQTVEHMENDTNSSSSCEPFKPTLNLLDPPSQAGNVNLNPPKAIINDLEGTISSRRNNSSTVIPITRDTSQLSKKTINILIKLLVIFMLDSFSYGLITSWIPYYYEKTFLMTYTHLGLLFSVGKIITASTVFPSSMITYAVGPVKATFIVQSISAIFLIAIPLLEFSIGSSISALMGYYATASMDVTPRQILLTDLVDANEITRVMGIVNVGKTLARCLGQLISGYVVQGGFLRYGFIISGSVLMLADIILIVSFVGIDKKVLRHLHKK
ncbi:MFS general substrate transporter [Hanseniaspora valbyensis NRRL Y-1626]|uniref:MFS general substrate transporter n=1 Tax=Hanseniaspora valbyensis NRRL Y-1626 TaxID=766949 RepID=A0A1B7THF1_9ASCO|nr:MFS general substrate transporter [Hanseniaspora valbyensis NRRL Y-1626]